VKFERIVYIPPIYFVGITDNGYGVILHPLSSAGSWNILTPSDLEYAYNQIKTMRNDPEGIQARKEEWEFFTKKYYEYYSPHSPYCKGHDKGTFVYKTSKKDMFTKNDTNKKFTELAWANYTQRDAGYKSCGPTAVTQIFMYARDVMNHRCIDREKKEKDTITPDLVREMETEDNGEGPTWPWNMDEGIENVAEDYGYYVEADWISIAKPSHLWEIFYDFISDYKMPQVFLICGWAYNWQCHYLTVVGALKRWWDWYCLSLTKHWAYYFDNRKFVDEKDVQGVLQRFRLDGYAHGFLGIESILTYWSGVTLTNFSPIYGYFYADKDGDGYSGFSAIESCGEPSPPPGYVSTFGGDCDDTKPYVHPSAPEICDGIDDNCDGLPMMGEWDYDGDGYMVCEGDCLDLGKDVIEKVRKWSMDTHPGATEGCELTESSDLGFLNDLCKWVKERLGGNCAIMDGTVYTLYVAIDRDCNGKKASLYYMDLDGDGYGSGYPMCFDVSEEGWAINSGDCDERNPYVHPGQTEVCNNCIDEDCDGIKDESGCVVKEICENGIDDDGDGTVDESAPDCIPNCCGDACKTGGWCVLVGKEEATNSFFNMLIFLIIIYTFTIKMRLANYKI